MKIEQIIEENKLIADFMGWIHSPDKAYDKYEMNNLKYHCDWNWLIPAVEKIELCFEGNIQVDIKGNNWVLIGFGSQYALTTKLELNIEKKGKTKIESVWLAVIEFIKWYNTR